MKTLPLGPFLGINNRLPDFALHVDKVGDFLRAADNVEVDNAGRLRRRRVTSKIAAMSSDAPHSLHMTSATAGYLVRASVLYAITLPSYTQTLVKALSSNAQLSWQAIGDDLYYSNGTDAGRLTAGAWYPLGLPTPEHPTLTVISGAMLAGRYQVALAYCNTTTGEEGGVSRATAVELSATGGLRVTLPGATAGATHVAIYLSACNGSQCYLAATVAAASTSADLTSTVAASARAAAQRFEIPLPAGRLFVSNGRLCSIVGSLVYLGLPYRHGYCLAAEGYIPFPEAVSLAVENQGGTYVCADKTYWFPGDLADGQGQVADVLPYGAVPGTAFSVPDQPIVGWFGAMGVVLADTAGQAKAVMNENIDVTPPASGIATVLQSNGYMRVVSCGWCINLENKAATTVSALDLTSTSGGYATASDGIYALDAGGDVAWSVGFGRLNLGSETWKALPYVYAGIEGATDAELTVDYVDERGVDRSYSYAARASREQLGNQRFDVGRGVRATGFDLTLSGTSEFTLASISFAPAATHRRI